MREQPRLIFGSSPSVLSLLDNAQRFARVSDPVLILGEPGTGKTVLARHIHALSARTGDFVAETAGNISRGMESVWLEGHSKGAYTGAHVDGKGLLEAAHQGTFFLDELDTASAELQVILLHLIEGGVVRRMREVRSRSVNVRIIAATNADLHKKVSEGGFRKDLHDRFGYMALQMPRLAERRDEILPLAERFLLEFAMEMGFSSTHGLSDQVRACFEIAPWPGNIRELRAVCRFAAVRAQERPAIEIGDLPAEFVAQFGDLGRRHHTRAADLREQVLAAIEKAGGNRSKAARIMGVSRMHFYRLASAVGLEIVLEMCNLASDRLHSFL